MDSCIKIMSLELSLEIGTVDLSPEVQFKCDLLVS